MRLQTQTLAVLSSPSCKDEGKGVFRFRRRLMRLFGHDPRIGRSVLNELEVQTLRLVGPLTYG